MSDSWVDELRGEHESDKEWTIKKSFLLAHCDNYDRERLVCLANCFINMEMYGCKYPQEVMMEVQGLAAQLAELEDYRNERREREAKRIMFVKGSSGRFEDSVKVSKPLVAPTKKKIKYTNFVSSGSNKTETTESESNAVDMNKTQELQPTNNELSQIHKDTEDIEEVEALEDVNDNPCELPKITKNFRDVYEKIESHISIKMGLLHEMFNLGSSDLLDTLVLCYEPNFMNMLVAGLAYYKHVLDTRKTADDNLFELFIDNQPVVSVQASVLEPLLSSIKTKNKSQTKKAGTLMSYRLLKYLADKCWVVVRKQLSTASDAVTTSNIQGSKTKGPDLGRGMELLKNLGWSEGAGLGATNQGIKQAVSLETTINRQGFGYNDASTNLKKCAQAYFDRYVKEGRTDVLVFSNEFTAEDRKVLHNIAARFGLKTQSRGKGDKRCLTVSKKGVSLNEQVKQLVDSGIYESDWCKILPPGSLMVT